MIQLKNVSKIFEVGGQPVHALVNINEHIHAGEFVAIIGPSGSGKSTLLHLIGCLLRPTQGSYRLNGQEVGTLSDKELSSVRQSFLGFIFQSFHLVPRLTAKGNVELPMIFAGISRKERIQRVQAALEAVGLTDRTNHYPAQLSVGQRQRVAIARATVMKPQVLLADEPTGNLDSVSGRLVLDLLTQWHQRGVTLLVVTHSQEVAQRAERVLVITDGRIVHGGGSDLIEESAAWNSAAHQPS